MLRLLQNDGHKTAEYHRLNLVLVVQAGYTELSQNQKAVFTRANLESLHRAAAESAGSGLQCSIELSKYKPPLSPPVREWSNSRWLYTCEEDEEDDANPDYERQLVARVLLSQGLKDWEPAGILEAI